MDSEEILEATGQVSLDSLTVAWAWTMSIQPPLRGFRAQCSVGGSFSKRSTLTFPAEKKNPACFRDTHPAWNNDNFTNLCKHIKSHLPQTNTLKEKNQLNTDDKYKQLQQVQSMFVTDNVVDEEMIEADNRTYGNLANI